MDSESHICGECAGSDPFVLARVQDEGEEAKCAFCDLVRITIIIEELGEMVHEIFKKYARKVDDDPWRSETGKSANELIEEILSCEPEVCDALLEYLADSHGLGPRDDGPDWYDQYSDAFELRARASDLHSNAWNEFVERVKHQGRFFNREAQEYLDDLLGPLLRGDLHNGKPPIVTLGAKDSEVRTIYRGRPADTSREQEAIYRNPARELGPPPAVLRKANRLNAVGVAAFYGALDVETCVAEVRAVVGGGVVVGKFKFVQPVRVLDLRLVDNAAAPLSFFDPAFLDKLGYGRLMRRLHNLMRTPVLPGSETLDYLPTQMIAEYLASKNVDGILYVSSLVNRPSPDDEDGYVRLREKDRKGVNVVLFAHASVVISEPLSPPYEVVKVEEPFVGADIPFQSQYVETRSVDGETRSNGVPEYPINDALEPTLRLAKKAPLTFSRVRGIEYEIDTYDVHFFSRDRAGIEDEMYPPF